MTEFTFTTEVDVRFRDLDPMGHVNNAVYSTFFEEGRAAYFRRVLDASLAEVDTVVAHIEVDFLRAVELDDDVTVAARVPRLGESSIPMEYEVRTDDGVAATGEAVQVAYDSDAGRPRPIPDDWRRRITEFEGL